MPYDDCDLCGRTTNVAKYKVEGAEVVACSNCGKHGTLIEEKSAKTFSRKSNTNNFEVSRKSSSPKQSSGPRPIQKKSFQQNRQDRNLVENYGRTIANARDKMGLTRLDLAKTLFIRETLLTKIETEKVRPDDDLVKTLEKTLNISLFEESTMEEGTIEFKNQASASSRNMTLGDFATIRKKKD